jgi:hypothetical protein
MLNIDKPFVVKGVTMLLYSALPFGYSLEVEK